MEIMKLFGRGAAGFALIFAVILLTGCQSGKKAETNNGPYGFDPLHGDTNMADNSGLPGSGAAAPAFVDTNGTTAILQTGETITVAFNDVYPPVTAIQDQIKEDGSTTLYFNEKFQAAGKTIRQLQAEIHDRYVPKYYRIMTPSITTGDRFFSVGGEVKAPNRYLWTPGMSVLRAIDASGGFTDFSKKTRVIITRANTRKQEYEDCRKAIKHPELDLPIYPGDQLFVKKKIW